MKTLTSLIGLLGAPFALGQEPLTGKQDLISTTSSATGGFMPLLQMLLALAVVVAVIKFAVPRLATRVNKKLVTTLEGGIKIEESANFAAGSLYVLTARKKTLLVSVTSSGVTCLADLSEPAAPEPASFREILGDQRQAAPLSPAEFREAVIEVEEPMTEAERQAKQMLDRLSRFAA